MMVLITGFLVVQLEYKQPQMVLQLLRFPPHQPILEQLQYLMANYFIQLVLEQMVYTLFTILVQNQLLLEHQMQL